MRISVLSSLSTVLVMAACVGPDYETGTRVQSLAHAGPWQIPTKTLEVGDTIVNDYTGAGPYNGGAACSGGMEPGTVELRDYIYQWFPASYSIGGYNCRPIAGTNTLSLHGTGRALDIMIPLAGPYADDNAADNDLGDPIGNWLIENADDIGIQLIIWDQYSWGSHRDVGMKGRDYGGSHPHHDHLHVELTTEAAALGTPFFQSDQKPPPTLPRCAPIPRSGAIIEDSDPCVQLFGPAEYWRKEEGVGHGGSLRWTNAYQGDQESNWARYILEFEEEGSYEVAVYLEPEYSRFRDTRYAITHADGITEVIVDQSAGDGWTSLGSFRFVAGVHQDVMVYDNSGAPVDDDQHIAVDALRIGEGEDGASLEGGCGCRTGGSPASGGFGGLVLLAALGLVRRRRSKRPS
jgi:MYXO-CTERM domain-containing protein